MESSERSKSEKDNLFVATTSRLAEFELIEWRRSGLSLVTNLSADRLSGPIRTSELHTLPLVISTSGLIADVLRGHTGRVISVGGLGLADKTKVRVLKPGEKTSADEKDEKDEK